MSFGAYNSNQQEYFWAKPHYNLANKFVSSGAYKALNPLRTRMDMEPGRRTQLPMYFGTVPQLSWLYGNLDYSYNKYHRHY